jgi:hypothetical protein
MASLMGIWMAFLLGILKVFWNDLVSQHWPSMPPDLVLEKVWETVWVPVSMLEV